MLLGKEDINEQAVKDYVEALQALLDGQERYDQEKIHPDKYSKVMRQPLVLSNMAFHSEPNK